MGKERKVSTPSKEIDQAEFELKLEATLDEAEKWWEGLEPEEKAEIYLMKDKLSKEEKKK